MRRGGAALAGALAFALGGCAAAPVTGGGAPDAAARRFVFERDTVHYANDLLWEYLPDGEGGLETRPRETDPEYARYCFVLARTARQFFAATRFAPDRPAPDAAALRALVERVTRASPRRLREASERIVIPGYTGLRELSRAHPELVKEAAGHWWQSYLQRGNWRMILPFPRWHQAWQAGVLADALDRGDPQVVHLVRFPSLAINHAVLVFGHAERDSEIRFRTYDPNHPDAPGELVFDRETRTFHMDANAYYEGGPLDAYRIYHNWIY